MMLAGMSVARLNFSHGSYDDHAQRIQLLRSISQELELPLTLLQDLQGPKIRVGDLSRHLV
jgi:pyruvate kinase